VRPAGCRHQPTEHGNKSVISRGLANYTTACTTSVYISSNIHHVQKKSLQCSMHNFNNCRHIFIIFGVYNELFIKIIGKFIQISSCSLDVIVTSLNAYISLLMCKKSYRSE